MRISAIIEARMSSKRLPGKVMADIGGKPMLEKLVERLRKSAVVDTLVVATPDTNDNRPIWEWCLEQKDIKIHRGSEGDVMKRVLDAAKATNTDIIVEITGDCPLIDPEIVNLIAAYCVCDHDCAVNINPTTWPQGMDVRAFKTECLAAAERETRGQDEYREHVSTYLYRKGSQFDWRNLAAPPTETCPELNLSVDTEEDLRRVKDIFSALEPLNPNFKVGDILKYLVSLPTYYDILSKPSLFKEAVWSTS